MVEFSNAAETRRFPVPRVEMADRHVAQVRSRHVGAALRKKKKKEKKMTLIEKDRQARAAFPFFGKVVSYSFEKYRNSLGSTFKEFMEYSRCLDSALRSSLQSRSAMDNSFRIISYHVPRRDKAIIETRGEQFSARVSQLLWTTRQSEWGGRGGGDGGARSMICHIDITGGRRK